LELAVLVRKRGEERGKRGEETEGEKKDRKRSC